MFHVGANHSTNYLWLKLPRPGTITIDEPWRGALAEAAVSTRGPRTERLHVLERFLLVAMRCC